MKRLLVVLSTILILSFVLTACSSSQLPDTPNSSDNPPSTEQQQTHASNLTLNDFIDAYNENTSFELAEKKLNRNIMCGKFMHEYNMVEKYHYGTLVIKCVFGHIIKVHKSNCRRKFDGKKRYKLNQLMGIVD